MRCLLIVTFAMFTASAWAQEVPKSPPKVEFKAEPKAAPKEAPKIAPREVPAAPAAVTVVPWPGGVWPTDGKFYPAGAFNVSYDATKYNFVTQQRQQCNGGVCQLIACPVLLLKDVVAGTVGTWAQGGCSSCPQQVQAAPCNTGCGQQRSCGQSNGCSFGFRFSLGGFFSCR